LFRILLRAAERIAQRLFLKRGAGFTNQSLFNRFKDFWFHFRRRSTGFASGDFGDGVRIDGFQECISELRKRFASDFLNLLRFGGSDLAIQTREPSGQRRDGILIPFTKGDAEQEFIESDVTLALQRA
jgi:hypothetical protein